MPNKIYMNVKMPWKKNWQLEWQSQNKSPWKSKWHWKMRSTTSMTKGVFGIVVAFIIMIWKN